LFNISRNPRVRERRQLYSSVESYSNSRDRTHHTPSLSRERTTPFTPNIIHFPFISDLDNKEHIYIHSNTL